MSSPNHNCPSCGVNHNLSAEDEVVESIWGDNPRQDLHEIFDNNVKWRNEMLEKDPDYFSKLSVGQKPRYLLIGCSDSRVGAQQIMGLDQGQIFVHRNIANLVVTSDLNLLSVIFYSVNVLKVKDIIVLGHYACGGIRAASENKDLGLIEHWLKNIRDVQRLHSEELSLIEDPEQKHRRLVELNIQEQCFNLYGNSIVQQMQAKTGRPRIHGMVYDIADGKLHYLDIDFKSQIKKYQSIYAVTDFHRYQPIDIHDIRDAAKHDERKETEETDSNKVAEQEKMTKLLFETIDTDHDGIIKQEDISENLCQYIDNVDEKGLQRVIQPFLSDDIDYEKFHEIMDTLHGAGVKEKDDSDRLVVVQPMWSQMHPHPIRCTALTTVEELKSAIQTVIGTPVDKQSLSFHGKILKNDNDTLSALGISDISRVELYELAEA